MSPPTPLSSGFAGLPPTPWQDVALGRTAPATTPAAAQHNSGDWFAQPSSSARVFSVQTSSLSNTDVDGWANQLIGHLLDTSDALK